MAKKNSAGKSLGHGHDKAEKTDSERSKSRPMTSVASITNSDAEEIGMLLLDRLGFC